MPPEVCRTLSQELEGRVFKCAYLMASRGLRRDRMSISALLSGACKAGQGNKRTRERESRGPRALEAVWEDDRRAKSRRSRSRGRRGRGQTVPPYPTLPGEGTVKRGE